MQKALIIIAHGSRREESNLEVMQLTDKVREQSNPDFELVRHAFLELAEPDLLTVVDALIQQGSHDITIMPYFLNSGNHVREDIPALLHTAKKRYPDCCFRLAAAIGTYSGMPELILQSASQA